MKRILIFICLLWSTTLLFAQEKNHKKSKQERREEKRKLENAIIKQEEENVLAYFRQNVFGIELRTNGYGIFYEIGKMKSPRLTTLYSLELSEIFHNKEEKIPTDNFFGNSYKFGKINNFYQAKLGYGQQYILGQKGNKNGVAILGIYQGGISCGLEKPYYVDANFDGNEQRSIKYDSPDSSWFLDLSKITGSSGPGKGWSDVKVKPGMFVKTALRFDFGAFNESITALEVGISAEGYLQKIDQMVFNKPSRFFYQGHIAIVFGSRK